jgi:hypothetical protein
MLTIPKIKPIDQIYSEEQRLFNALDNELPININNWENYAYKPQVTFKIAHTNTAILLDFYVREKYIRALETHTNGQVFKDSCVEFFISFDKLNYYNFEFSCIGTTHLAYGLGKCNRQLVSNEIIHQIKKKSSLGDQPFSEKSGDFEWHLTTRIPVSCFAFDYIKTLKGLNATANFYKCGDETTEPHYLSWKPIQADNPNFHRPEFFGDIFFQ